MRDRLQENFGSSVRGQQLMHRRGRCRGGVGGGGGAAWAWGWAHFWECRDCHHLLGEFGRTH